ncbi:MAG: oligosaccharide flippase family protein, partial [Ignavibacteria bacterium]|nr:oligosaccharide flippase family protein [Ignavibacteria bacterium]
STFTTFLNALFKGYERLELETKVSFVSNMGLMVLAVMLIILHASVVLIAISFFISKAIGFVIGLKYSFKLLDGIRFKLIFSDFNKIKGKMFVFGIHFLFNYLYFQIDTIILAVMKGDYYVGIYQAAFKLIALALVLPEILNNALLPTLSRLNVENIVQWKKAGYLMNKILLLIGLPIAIVFFVYAEQIIPFVYGSKNYLEAIPVLRVFSVVLIIRLSLEAYSLMLTTSDRQKIRMWVVLGATILNVVLNVILVPKLGVFGVAIVSVITNGLVLLVYSSVTYPLFKEWTLNRRTMSIIFLACTVLCILWLMKDVNFILCGIIVFMFFSFVSIKYFLSREEKDYLFRGSSNSKFQN